MIAIGAGDRSSATRAAIQARRAIPNEPLTHLLRAQAAQLTGDRATARRIFEAMLGSPDTEQLGLRGLYMEARREGEPEAAMQFAERAARLNPRLGWPLEAQFEMQLKASDWAGAAETTATAKRHGHLDRPVADRRRALMLTAQAQSIEEADPDKALALATEAHTLAPDLIPAAAVAGRILAARGQTAKAAKIIQRTWSKSPHPDLAAAYAYARIGDSPNDRLDRIKQLALLKPHDVESGVAWATAAIDAREFGVARHALQPFLKDKLTRRVARLMARIEIAEKNDAGRAREWIARAATAARDPVWTADGVVLDTWSPVSPVTGYLDAVEWRVPVSGPDTDADTLAAEIAGLLTIDPDAAPMIEAKTNGDASTVTAAAHVDKTDGGPASEPGSPDPRTASATAT
jgi:HemY protein